MMLSPQPWQFQCLVDKYGKKCIMTYFWMPPLGQVTIRLYNNLTVITICQGLDPFVNLNDCGSNLDESDCSEPDVFCCGPLCYKLCYEGHALSFDKLRCWLLHLKGGHPDGASNFTKNDMRVLQLGKVNPYGEKGDPMTQYAYQVKRGVQTIGLSPRALCVKGLRFQQELLCDLRNPRIGEGYMPKGYHAALEKYGPRNGCREERVLWIDNKLITGLEDYYNETGEDYLWRAQQDRTPPWKQPWHEEHTGMKLSSFSTPSDVQEFVDKMLPPGWKVITPQGIEKTSRRKIRTKEMTLEEKQGKWLRKYGEGNIGSGSDSDSD
ncbi:Bel-2 protein [Simian foamy virus Pongo pygmaeus pygmaeus]|uniref:Bel-2 protein n=1 Tax=Simian foamy virus Pongo pygmaeus pygmaeus TaxID=221703 RepID=Q7SIS3_9RETR|nr:Bel-2 protein [Simian foamy virus Pongo pygmaeus pygmaeus]CAD67565.1 Bel-2 protein [Simian foamy virus Pongo pygmaeus pygmaeus]